MVFILPSHRSEKVVPWSLRGVRGMNHVSDGTRVKLSWRNNAGPF